MVVVAVALWLHSLLKLKEVAERMLRLQLGKQLSGFILQPHLIQVTL
jgi:hypothetical protein